jgi:hypothetical protein
MVWNSAEDFETRNLKRHRLRERQCFPFDRLIPALVHDIFLLTALILLT